jgi:hypothetical protein
MLQRSLDEGKGDRMSVAKGHSRPKRGGNRGNPPLGLDDTIDLAGVSGESGSLEADDSLGAADDEDDPLLSIPKHAAMSGRKGEGLDAFSEGPREAKAYVPNRPSDKLWLHHIAGKSVTFSGNSN